MLLLAKTMLNITAAIFDPDDYGLLYLLVVPAWLHRFYHDGPRNPILSCSCF